MCWSYRVSTTVATAEAFAVLFMAVRSYISRDPWVRRQWLLLPGLSTICAMEAIEAYLWYHQDSLLDPIDQSTMRPCAARNHALTAVVWTCLLPWQPLWVILPCRRANPDDTVNRLRLQIPEALALVFALCHCFVWAVTYYSMGLSSLPSSDDNSHRLLRSLADSDYTSYLHVDTCTYVGRSGHHLHWAVALMDHFAIPNAYTYALLWLSLVGARPRRFAAAIYLVLVALFGVQLVWFQGSWEAGSVWCWAAAVVFGYFLVQPYVLPCRPMEKNVVNMKRYLKGQVYERVDL
jgi:hypothetical protein